MTKLEELLARMQATGLLRLVSRTDEHVTLELGDTVVTLSSRQALVFLQGAERVPECHLPIDRPFLRRLR